MDAQGTLHLMYSALAQSHIAAAASDWAADNQRNPKSVLANPGGVNTYMNKYQEEYEACMKYYIPGSRGVLRRGTPEAGSKVATYSSTPC